MVPQLESLGQHIAILEVRQMSILKAQLAAPAYDTTFFVEDYLPDLSPYQGPYSNGYTPSSSHILPPETFPKESVNGELSDDWLSVLLNQIQAANSS